MYISARCHHVPGAVSPDPVASPQSVDAREILRLPRTAFDHAGSPLNTLIVLEAPSAETLTVDVYLVDDGILQAVEGAIDSQPLLGTRRFYLLASAVTLTGGTLYNIGTTGAVGSMYLAATADTLAATRAVLGAVI